VVIPRFPQLNERSFGANDWVVVSEEPHQFCENSRGENAPPAMCTNSWHTAVDELHLIEMKQLKVSIF
jgi:hypothetical protein